MKLTPHVFILADGRSPDSPQMLALARQIAAPYHNVADKQLQMTADAMVAASLGTYKTVRAYGDVRILTQITPGVSRVVIDVAMRKILAEQAQEVGEPDVLPYLWIGVRAVDVPDQWLMSGKQVFAYLYEPGVGVDETAEILTNVYDGGLTEVSSVASIYATTPEDAVALYPTHYKIPYPRIFSTDETHYNIGTGLTSYTGRIFATSRMYMAMRAWGGPVSGGYESDATGPYYDAVAPHDPLRLDRDHYYALNMVVDPQEEIVGYSAYFDSWGEYSSPSSPPGSGFVSTGFDPDVLPAMGFGHAAPPVAPYDKRRLVPTQEMFTPASRGKGKARAGLYTLKLSAWYSAGIEFEITVRSGKLRGGGVASEKVFTVSLADFGRYGDPSQAITIPARMLVPGGQTGLDPAYDLEFIDSPCYHGYWWWQGGILCDLYGRISKEDLVVPWGITAGGTYAPDSVPYGYGALGMETGYEAFHSISAADQVQWASRVWFYLHHMDGTEQAAIDAAWVTEATTSRWTVSLWASYPQISAVESTLSGYLGGGLSGRTVYYSAVAPYLGSPASPTIDIQGDEVFGMTVFTGSGTMFNGHPVTHKIYRLVGDPI